MLEMMVEFIAHKKIKVMTKETIEDIYRYDPVKACRMALRRTVKLPSEERLEAINKLLHGYGTEAIRGNWQNGYWCDIVACYVNVGDTYGTTVVQVRFDYGRGSMFRVCSYGDWVERNSKKYGIY